MILVYDLLHTFWKRVGTEQDDYVDTYDYVDYVGSNVIPSKNSKK